MLRNKCSKLSCSSENFLLPRKADTVRSIKFKFIFLKIPEYYRKLENVEMLDAPL